MGIMEKFDIMYFDGKNLSNTLLLEVGLTESEQSDL